LIAVLIQIDKLKRLPRQIVINEQATDFPVLRELVERGDVVFSEAIAGTLEATWAGDVIEVAGVLATRVTSPCRRCLMPVANQLEIQVMLCYAGKDAGEEAPVVEELELQSEELGLIPFPGPEIDLRADLDQEIIMALPQQPLCQESCQGLCPVCGCNLNQSRCDCEPPVFHAGLAALKNFKTKQ
jgi:uncharacterized protein